MNRCLLDGERTRADREANAMLPDSAKEERGSQRLGCCQHRLLCRIRRGRGIDQSPGPASLGQLQEEIKALDPSVRRVNHDWPPRKGQPLHAEIDAERVGACWKL